MYKNGGKRELVGELIEANISDEVLVGQISDYNQQRDRFRIEYTNGTSQWHKLDERHGAYMCTHHHWTRAKREQERRGGDRQAGAEERAPRHAAMGWRLVHTQPRPLAPSATGMLPRQPLATLMARL